jgi:hypothetical protein
MLEYIMFWIWQIGWRLAVTLICILSVQNILLMHGFHMKFEMLFGIAFSLILGVRIWIFNFESKKE